MTEELVSDKPSTIDSHKNAQNPWNNFELLKNMKTCSAALYLWKWCEPEFTQTFCPQSLSRRCPREIGQRREFSAVSTDGGTGQMIRRRKHAEKEHRNLYRGPLEPLVQYLAAQDSAESWQKLTTRDLWIQWIFQRSQKAGEEAITIQNGVILESDCMEIVSGMTEVSSVENFKRAITVPLPYPTCADKMINSGQIQKNTRNWKHFGVKIADKFWTGADTWKEEISWLNYPVLWLSALVLGHSVKQPSS